MQRIYCVINWNVRFLKLHQSIVVTLKIRYTSKIQSEWQEKKTIIKSFSLTWAHVSPPVQLYLLAKLTTFRIYLPRSAIKFVFGQIVPSLCNIQHFNTLQRYGHIEIRSFLFDVPYARQHFRFVQRACRVNASMSNCAQIRMTAKHGC